MEKDILASIQEGIKVISLLKDPLHIEFIRASTLLIAECFYGGGKLLIAGNGGSLCDAMHFAEELTGLFRKKRKALPAIALSCPGHLTCTGNDLGFEEIFARGVEAYGKKGDLFIGLTTSGNSPNILRALEVAKEKQLQSILFLGKGGGKLKGKGDLELIIDGSFPFSDRVQEAHMTAIHIIIEMVEKRLFP